ncbi:MAG: hypothetical protein R6V04_07265, partial [bacterium]
EDASVQGDGEVVVKGDELDHFKVTATQDTISYSDSTTVLVQAKDKEGNYIQLSDDILLDFNLDSNGEKYGNLIALNGEEVKSLTAIPYGDAKTGNIKYIANGENPIGCDPQKVMITVLKSDDISKNGSDSVSIKCKIDYTRFAQGDPNWGEEKYDTYIKEIVGTDTIYHTISAKGCALTCMAMVLKANGVNTNPGKLNTWMINNNGFNSFAVKWYRLPEDNKVQLYDVYGNGLNSGSAVSLKDIDPYLQKCYFVIAQVKNPETNKNHWIIIRELKSSIYNIVDPGQNHTTLIAYDSEIYRVIIYKKNQCVCND